MKTASSEVRMIAVKAYGTGIPRQQIADIVGYHLNSVSRWIREFELEKPWTAFPQTMPRAGLNPVGMNNFKIEML